MDQLTILPELGDEIHGINPKDEALFEKIRPAMESILGEYWIAPEKLFLAPRQGYTSVCLASEKSLIMRIISRERSSSIALPSRARNALPEEVKYKRTSDGYLRVSLSGIDDKALADIAAKAADLAIMTYPSTFGCCAMYRECSDACRCLQAEADDLYLGCYYRRNLKQGAVFYGKNKTA